MADARSRFSELVQSAASEPQMLYNRGRPVAVLIDPQEYDRFCQWKAGQATGSIAAAFAEIRERLGGESYTLEVPARRDRVNPFAPPKHS